MKKVAFKPDTDSCVNVVRLQWMTGALQVKSCCVRQGLEWAGEYWELSGNQTAVQQGRERIREENGGWGRKSLRWQVGGDLGFIGDRQGFLGGSDGSCLPEMRETQA